jgi:hypothetical protein
MFVDAWSRDVFMLAAVLYFSGSDLLHMARGYPTDDEFLASIQSTANAWAGLVHATGRSLKPQKCFWYRMGWRWIKGVPRMRKLCKLPHVPLTKLHPNGAQVAIILKDVNDPCWCLNVVNNIRQRFF